MIIKNGKTSFVIIPTKIRRLYNIGVTDVIITPKEKMYFFINVLLLFLYFSNFRAIHIINSGKIGAKIFPK